jgi:phospholipid transport system substrate-binding protein
VLHVLTVPVLAAALVLFTGQRVSGGAATDRLRDFFAAVNTVLADPTVQERPLEAVPRIQRLVAGLSDVGAASAVALGSEWHALTPGERAEFIEPFAELLERAYVARLGGTAQVIGGVKVSYLDESLAGDEATVATALRARDGSDVAVEYRMTNHNGRWLVRDIVMDGVSTVENYRAQFKRLLRRGSYATLVSRLRAKLNEESLIFARAAPRGPAARPTAVAALEIPTPEIKMGTPPPEHVEPALGQPPEQVEPTSAAGPGAAVAGVRAARASPVSRAPRPVAAASVLPARVTAASQALLPPATRAEQAATPDPPEVAWPATAPPVAPPSSADADPIGPFLLALSLGLVGVASAAYLSERGRRGKRPLRAHPNPLRAVNPDPQPAPASGSRH